MRINIPQIVEKSPKRHVRFLAKFLRNQLLNNYCGLRQRLAATRLACVELTGLKPRALTRCQQIWPTLPHRGEKAMKGSSDRKGPSSTFVRASETTGTHLAHWPPPQRSMERGKESKPVLVTQAAGEPAKRARSRGWRLTRALFSEVDDDD
jgi:hypothetical protein